MSRFKANMVQAMRGLGVNVDPNVPPGTTNFCQWVVTHNGVPDINVMLDNDWVILSTPCKYLPKTNLAPLYRQMLLLNNRMLGSHLAIQDNDNMILLKSTCLATYCDTQRLLELLNLHTACYYQLVVPMQQQFPPSQMPT
jgi:hypothetical protein